MDGWMDGWMDVDLRKIEIPFLQWSNSILAK